MLHVDIPTRDEIEGLIRNRGSALVSLYLPTTPVTPHALMDRTVLKNLTAEAVRQLADHDKREVRSIEELLFDLIDDDLFWEFQANSLAVFVTPESIRTFRLPNRLQPIVEISDRFHIKPLLRAVTVPQSAVILALAQNSVRVIEFSADMSPLEMTVEGMPKDVASAVDKASIKDRSLAGRMQGSEGMKARLVQYARKIDQALRNVLGGRETPLILAAAEPLRSIYRALQSYPHLATTSIQTNPESMSDAELVTEGRAILDELFRDQVAEIRLLFEQRANQWRTTTDVSQAARAVTNGAVQMLLIDIDEVMPGTLDDEGGVIWANGPCAASYSITDEIARRALLTGARVLGARRADIPREGSLAAIMRYPV